MSGRGADGRFLPGNEIWRTGEQFRQPRKYKTPDELLEACLGYLDWCQHNPYYEAQLVSYQGDSKQEPVPKMRAATNSGLCVFLHINRSTWADWRKHRDDLKDVIEYIDAIIEDRNIGGAAAGILNASLIARLVGLADRQELTGKDGGAIQSEVKTDAATFAGRMAELSANASRKGTGGTDGGSES